EAGVGRGPARGLLDRGEQGRDRAREAPVVEREGQDRSREADAGDRRRPAARPVRYDERAERRQRREEDERRNDRIHVGELGRRDEEGRGGPYGWSVEAPDLRGEPEQEREIEHVAEEGRQSADRQLTESGGDEG